VVLNHWPSYENSFRLKSPHLGTDRAPLLAALPDLPSRRKFVAAFDSVLVAAGTEVRRKPALSPLAVQRRPTSRCRAGCVSPPHTVAREQQAVTRVPGGLADSALEHAELVAETSTSARSCASKRVRDEHEVSNEPDERVGDAEKQAGRSSPIAPTIRGQDSRLSPKGATTGPAPVGANRTDAAGVTAQVKRRGGTSGPSPLQPAAFPCLLHRGEAVGLLTAIYR